jgi:hypothetical protein
MGFGRIYLRCTLPGVVESGRERMDHRTLSLSSLHTILSRTVASLLTVHGQSNVAHALLRARFDPRSLR